MIRLINSVILSALLAVSFFHTTAVADWERNQIPQPAGAFGFGESVTFSRDGHTALIAAPYEACAAGGFSCGAAYVYVRDGASWRFQARLVPSDAEAERQFGGYEFDDHTVSLSADGHTALISGINPGTLTPKGAVYVFVRTGESWGEQQK